MPDSPSQTDLIQTLQGLVERLSAPDLTVSEANELRPRLHGLLETSHAGLRPADAPRGRCRERAAGCVSAL